MLLAAAFLVWSKQILQVSEAVLVLDILEPGSYMSGKKKISQLLFQYIISAFSLQQLERQRSGANKSCGGADEGKNRLTTLSYFLCP